MPPFMTQRVTASLVPNQGSVMKFIEPGKLSQKLIFCPFTALPETEPLGWQL